jgi:ABC-type metal ion transport system substrate-binding protein
VILNKILIAECPKDLTDTTIKNAEILSDDIKINIFQFLSFLVYVFDKVRRCEQTLLIVVQNRAIFKV